MEEANDLRESIRQLRERIEVSETSIQKIQAISEANAVELKRLNVLSESINEQMKSVAETAKSLLSILQSMKVAEEKRLEQKEEEEETHKRKRKEWSTDRCKDSDKESSICIGCKTTLPLAKFLTRVWNPIKAVHETSSGLYCSDCRNAGGYLL